MAERFKRSEADVKRAVVELLKARGVLCFRMNAGDQIVVHGKSRHRVMGNPSGTADILCFPQRTYSADRSNATWQEPEIVWLELKSPTGEQSAEQKQFQQMVEDEGHTYLLIRSAAELEEWLRKNM